jgi:hypothetical protein
MDPADTANQISFLLIGIAILLPWNAILAAMDFFTESFPNYKPSFSLLAAISGPMLISQCASFFFLRYIPLHARMTFTFLVNTICTLIFVLAPLLLEDQATAYYTVIATCMVYGASVGLL